MARNVLVDTGFLVALLSRRDGNHRWAVAQSQRFPPPWSTCEAVLSEAFHLLEAHGAPALAALLRRRAVVPTFALREDFERTLKLMEKYADVPMGLADACLVRMTEAFADPVLLTTDTDFRVYRRHSRQAVPCVIPS
ncbi:MAG TPA: PIN domain-containing protein [Burkholderiales bacterium]|jgi:predicted nucleic acid-binding protein|nr:PIN domain-containing protein [Burkholderiales bacterium]